MFSAGWRIINKIRMPDYKKFLHRLRGRFPRERMVKLAIGAILFLFLAVLMLDGVIFFRYYQIAVESPEPATLKRVSISKDDLDRVLEIIGEHEKK